VDNVWLLDLLALECIEAPLAKRDALDLEAER
jgi:hypothetical protein